MKKFYRYYYSLFPVFIGGLIGFSLMKQQKEIYTIYHLPPWMPPQWMFGFVWSVLYLLLGYSLYLIYCAPKSKHTYLAGGLLILQLMMNFLWCFIFFLFHQLFLAMLWLIVIFGLAVLNCWVIEKIERRIWYYHIPYVMWLVFAGYLSISIWIMNP